MKETLDDKSRCDLVKYRLDRASETLDEARLMHSTAHYNTAVNRLYYACFYAVNALLLKYGISAHTHNGTKSMLGLHFVSNGKIPQSDARIYSLLFHMRNSSDYDDFIYCDKAMVEDYIPKAEAFIEHIKELIAIETEESHT